MATVLIGARTYPSYVSVDDADIYLAADFQRAEAWDSRTADQKGQGLASATRMLQGLQWKDGTPSTTSGAPQAVLDACCLLAADILTDPELISNPSSASNVKSAQAGSAKVEFFLPQAGTPLPSIIWNMLKPYLGGGASELSSGAWGAAFGTDQCSRFDDTDYELSRPFQ